MKRKRKIVKTKRIVSERLSHKPTRDRIAALDRMYEGQQITQAQHDAGVRLRSDYETAHGAGGGQSEKVDGSRTSYGPSERQIDAHTALRRALEAVGPEFAMVLLAAVCRGLSMRAAAAEVERSDKTVREWVIRALVELDAHYVAVRRERRRAVVEAVHA